MVLEQLLIRPRGGAAMVPVGGATAAAGLGLVGDRSAARHSPRQVLVTSGAVLARHDLTAADVRANLVVAGDVDALRSGTVLRFGAVRIRLTLPCEVCHRLERVRPGLARALAGRRGMLGRVLDDGALAPGLVGGVVGPALPALADDWRARVVDVLRHLPRGRVVTTTRLAAIAGVQVTYCRALPAVLRRAPPDVAVDRVIPADLTRLAADQRQRLAADGVDVDDLAAATWDGAAYYAASEP
ncbi:MAG: MGMT family protein [Myxococcales bacterium]|nr:MGMT family protein [Myxococcales bacterium]